jgi:CDP-diacylglycerol--glycerol-3-phosphate 3-phosphatidyltransferase
MFPLNVPNVLTVVRILLVPVLVVALLANTSGGDLLAAIVFASASVTDAVDGRLARAQGAVTTFGKLMDPLADKLLVMGALISLVSDNRLAAWVAMVIIAREFAVTVLRVAAGTQQGIVIPASPFGKLKTGFQVLMVMVLIAVHGRPPWVEAIVYVTVVITVLSGVDYFFGSARPRVPSGVVADGAVSAGTVSSGGVEPRPPARVS